MKLHLSDRLLAFDELLSTTNWPWLFAPLPFHTHEAQLAGTLGAFSDMTDDCRDLCKSVGQWGYFSSGSYIWTYTFALSDTGW